MSTTPLMDQYRAYKAQQPGDTRRALPKAVEPNGKPTPVRYARKGGGFMASRAAENIGVRTSALTVRVLHRENVGRPVVGDRKRLGTHLFGVAEYHGSRCYRVIGATDSLTAALSLADETARDLGKDAQVITLPTRKRRVSAKKATTPKRTKPVAIKRADASVKAPEMADAQALHVRDINTVGYCTACNSKKREHPCGKEDKPATLADALAVTAHLRAK